MKRKTFLGLLILFLSGLWEPATFGQSEPSVSTAPAMTAPDDGLTIEKLGAKIAALKSDKELDDTARIQATDLYNSAILLLGRIQADDTQVAAYRDALDHGMARAQAIRQELKQAATSPATTALATEGANLTAKDLEEQLMAHRAVWQDRKTAAATVDRQINDLRNGKVDLAAEIATAQRQLDRASQPATRPVANEAPAVAEARRILSQAQQRAAGAHLQMLQLRRASASPMLELLTAQSQQAQRQVDSAAAVLRALVDQLAAKHRQEAQRVQTEAQRAESEGPAVRAIAQENVKFSQQATDLVNQTEQARQTLRAVSAQLNQIRQSYTVTKDELQIQGVGTDLAEELRKQRDLLPSAERHRREVTALHRQTNLARMAQLKTDQERQNLADLDQRARHVVDQQVPPVPPAQRPAIEERVRGLLNDRAELLDNFSDANARYLEILRLLEDRQQELAGIAQDFAILLDERLLWIPSASPVSPAWLGKVLAAARWLGQAAYWEAVGLHLAQGALDQALWVLPLLVAIVALGIARRRLLEQLDAMGQQVRQHNVDGLKVTARVLAFTVLAVLPGPLFLWLCSAVLAGATGPSEGIPEFMHAFAHGLNRVALLWFSLESLRQLCRPHGVADAHFGWDNAARQALRRNLSWLEVVYLPLTFVIATTHASGNDEYSSSLGRLAFVAMSLALAIFLRQVLHPRTGVLTPLLAPRHAGWAWRTRRVWHPLAVAVPLLLGAAALRGYYYAALAIEARMLRSIILIIVAVLLHNLVTRWLVLSQQKVTLRHAAEERAAAENAKAGREAAQAAGEGAPKIIETPPFDLAASNAQTRALWWTLLWVFIAVGLWMIWAPLLPALQILDEVHPLRNVNLSLAGFGKAVLLAILTVIATRNVTGVLEIALLQRLALDAGIRYAIDRIAIYLIMLVGTVATLQALGIGWGQVQWLAAAFSLGLGFGLQEIFANFVSGLIVLFERPLRVGDIVTVDGLTGTVSRIRMRATTITDWDNKEMIVPNKTFITNRLINWTLTNPTTRLVIKVAVSHNSDVRVVERLIIEAAQAHRLVLREPPPKVFVTDFGAGGAMNLELRVFLREPADQMPVLNDLHLAIDDAFRKNQIAIL